MGLWAERYEDEFFQDKPETNIDIDSEEDEGEIEDITPDDAQIDVNADNEEEDMALDALLE